MKLADIFRIPASVTTPLVGLLCALLLAVPSVGCGALGYVKNVTFDASSSVAAAKTANADKWAPYEYTRAKEYLHKSREEAAAADFQAANRFGKLAHKAAVKAQKLAVKRAANPRDTDWMPPESLREGDSGKDGGDDGDQSGDNKSDEISGESTDDKAGDGDDGDGDGEADASSDSGDDSTGGDDQ